MIISIEGLCIACGDKDILNNINLSIAKGEMVAVIGPNGGGKTTLLKSIIGDNESCLKQVGKLEVNENNLAYVGSGDAIDIQFPVSVFDFLLSGVFEAEKWFDGAINSDVEKRIKEVMDLMNLNERVLSSAFPSLSSGQKQRVNFARILLKAPKLLVMDEPFSNVEHSQTTKIMSLLKNMSQTQGITVVVAVHDYYTLHNYFDRAILIASTVVSQGEVHSLIDYNKFCRICDSYSR